MACAVTPDGRRVVFAFIDGTLKAWDLESGSFDVIFDSSDLLTGCAVSPDGRRVASVARDKPLRIWDLDSGYLVATSEVPIDWAAHIVVTPDRRCLVSAAKAIEVWDLDR